MQNRYVGDVGDFGKYALLRIIGQTNLKLGVNWYLVPDENQNSDGKHKEYLYNNDYAGCDDELYYILKNIVENAVKDVHSVQNSEIFPQNTIFYDSVLELTGEIDPLKRHILRQSWHKAALCRLENCDIVFLDPDNGIQVKSVSLTGQKGNKYIGLDELKDYYRLEKSIVFYNHRERKQENEYLDKFIKLQNDSEFKNSKWLGLKFCRGTIRDYIFILQPKHFNIVKAQCEVLLDSPWKSHFSMLYF